MAWITQPTMLVFVEPATSFANKCFALPALTFTIEKELKWLQAMYAERVATVELGDQQISLCVLCQYV